MQLIAIARAGTDYVASDVNIDPNANVWEIAQATMPDGHELVAVVEGARGNDALVYVMAARVDLRPPVPEMEPARIAGIAEPVLEKPKRKR